MQQIMKKFVMFPRHGQPVTEDFSRAELAEFPDQTLIQPLRTLRSGAQLIQTTEEVAQAINFASSHFMVEEVRYYYPLIEVHKVSQFRTLDLSSGQNAIKVKVKDASGTPVPGALVLAASDRFPDPFIARTDDNGLASIEVLGWKFFVAVVPYANFWDFSYGIVDLNQSKDPLEVTVRTLRAPGTWDWGHYAMETHLAADQFHGNGVKVAIIDTAVQADHEDLSVKGGANMVETEATDSWRDDPHQHGTHCSGIACALANAIGITGHAPAADLVVYKVFPAQKEGASNIDLVEAIYEAIDDDVDVINMSLGHEFAGGESVYVTQGIQRAFNKGIVCCIAAGNDDNLVGWPAAAKVPNIVSVAAIGQFGLYPDDSLHKRAESGVVSRDGKYFRARFSNYADEDGDPKVDVCAPGAACISTVKGGYAAFKGTSMASPHVAGTCALLLAAHPEIRNPKDQMTAVRAIDILKASCKDLGMSKKYQGIGMPSDFLATRPAT